MFLNWFIHGIIKFPWWSYFVYVLITTHITILSVTIYLHRYQAHRALILHPVVSHFFRFWLWLTTGIITKEWVAVHRKHHAFADKKGDPHSPHIFGINTVLKKGAELYREECKNQQTLVKYSNGTPNDWIEHNLYSKYSKTGISILLLLNITLFGILGLSAWAVQMLWIPIFAAGIINGLGHWSGYRNFEIMDKACNILPLGFIIGGEELHNNHHTFATSAKFSFKWYEIDIGWAWIKLLSYLRLAVVKRTIPEIHIAPTHNASIDKDTLTTIITGHYHLAVLYVKTLSTECKAELLHLAPNLAKQITWSQIKRILMKDPEQLNNEDTYILSQITRESSKLEKIVKFRHELSSLWVKSNKSHDDLIKALHEWCHKADSSDIKSLHLFSQQLKSIT